MLDVPSGNSKEKGNHEVSGDFSVSLSETEADSMEMELSETENSLQDENMSMNESDSEEDSMLDSNGNQEREVYFTKIQDESVSSTTGSCSSSVSEDSHYYNKQYL